MPTIIHCEEDDLIEKDGYTYKVLGFHINLQEIRNGEPIGQPTYSVTPEHVKDYKIINKKPEPEIIIEEIIKPIVNNSIDNLEL